MTYSRGGHPYRIATDGLHVYWSEGIGDRFCSWAPRHGRLLSVSTGGGPMSVLANIDAGAIAIDQASIYVFGASNHLSGIVTLPKGGGSSTALTGTPARSALALDAKNVYFAGLDGIIYSLPKTGGTSTTLFTPSSTTVSDDFVSDIAVLDGRVYWASRNTKTGVAHLQRVRSNGSAHTVLRSAHIDRIALDEDAIYSVGGEAGAREDPAPHRMGTALWRRAEEPSWLARRPPSSGRRRPLGEDGQAGVPG